MNTTQTQVRSTEEALSVFDTLKLALEALKDNQHLVADNERHMYVMEYNSIIEKCEEALAQQPQDVVRGLLSNEQVEPVAWTDKAFERLCENWNHMTSEEFAIVQRFIFGVYAHPPVPYVVEPRNAPTELTAQPKE